MIRGLLTLLVCALFPAAFKPPLLSLLGHRVRRGARIGPNLVWRTRLSIDAGASMRALNVVACRRLVMRRDAIMGVRNTVLGPVSLRLGPRSVLGNFNWVSRAPAPVSVGPSNLWMGELSSFTSRHSIDCTESIVVGDFTTFAGRGSQFWTHGYVHHLKGDGRYRLDGKIRVGSNAYIGSGSCITAGVNIADGVSVAPFTSISTSLTLPGLYFGQRLVHVSRLPEDRCEGLPKLAPGVVCETVYWKGGGGPNALAQSQQLQPGAT